MNPKLILAVALALLLLVSAPAQGADPTASSPSPRRRRRPASCAVQATTPGGARGTSTTTARSTTPKARAKKAFEAGAHVVRLRARFTSGAESIATRTIQVGTPPADPDETATPEPTATRAVVNQPPVAKIATGCVPGGVCSGLIAREEQPHTLDGTARADPDGTIVRYEWTVDGTTLEEAGADVHPHLHPPQDRRRRQAHGAPEGHRRRGRDRRDVDHAAPARAHVRVDGRHRPPARDRVCLRQPQAAVDLQGPDHASTA